MRVLLAAAGFGVVFGFVLSWARFTDPDAIRRMLLLEEAYLFLVFFSAIAVAFAGARLARRARVRAALTGEPVSWVTSRPERRHLTGSVLFGVGWGISSSCPGPIAAQLGQGMRWSSFTIVGIVLGILVHRARARTVAVKEVTTDGSRDRDRHRDAQVRDQEDLRGGLAGA